MDKNTLHKSTHLRVTASGSLKMADKAQKDMVVSAEKSQP